ncbi:MAG: carboxypeptidase, partial [Actinomycetes bacterium]
MIRTPRPRTRVASALLATAALTMGAVVGVPAAAQPLDSADPAALPVQIVRVNTPAAADKTRLNGLGLDLTEHAGPGFVEVVLH